MGVLIEDGVIELHNKHHRLVVISLPLKKSK